MKKLLLTLVTVFLISGITSCTPELLQSQDVQPEACCGETDPIPPPPPPPPPDGNN